MHGPFVYRLLYTRVLWGFHKMFVYVKILERWWQLYLHLEFPLLRYSELICRIFSQLWYANRIDTT